MQHTLLMSVVGGLGYGMDQFGRPIRVQRPGVHDLGEVLAFHIIH